MRRHGPVSTAAGLGLHGHGCWTYADDHEFRAGAHAFLNDGVELGQALMYVGAGTIAKLRSDLDDLPEVDRLLGEGRLRIMPIENVYAVGEPLDPTEQLTMFSTATSMALVDGYTGLRVVADVTSLVLDAELWPAHLHWESVADRYAAKNPLAGLCCYDRRALPDEILADLCCVHRTSNGPPSVAPFRLFAGREGLSLAGEVDAFSADDLRRLLAAVTPASGDLVLELDELEFVDHHGLTAIADHARALAREGRKLDYRGAPPSFDRLAGLLEIGL
jgi:anti-anti-sigma regulatory factor